MLIEFNQSKLELIITPENIEESDFLSDIGYGKHNTRITGRVERPKIGKMTQFPVLIIEGKN